MEQFLIHVQYTQTESICVRHFTIRLDLHSVDPQPLSALLEVKIHEIPVIMIHEPSSFLKHGKKLQSICMRHFTTRFVRSCAFHKSTSGMTNRQQGKRFVSIRSNRQQFQPTLHSSGALYFLSLAQMDFRHLVTVCRLFQRGSCFRGNV